MCSSSLLHCGFSFDFLRLHLNILWNVLVSLLPFMVLMDLLIQIQQVKINSTFMSEFIRPFLDHWHPAFWQSQDSALKLMHFVLMDVLEENIEINKCNDILKRERYLSYLNLVIDIHLSMIYLFFSSFSLLTFHIFSYFIVVVRDLIYSDLVLSN